MDWGAKPAEPPSRASDAAAVVWMRFIVGEVLRNVLISSSSWTGDALEVFVTSWTHDTHSLPGRRRAMKAETSWPLVSLTQR